MLSRKTRLVSTSTRRHAILALTAACTVPVGAQPHPFPSRAVKIVVPFAVGGAVDVLARSLAVPLSRGLGQPVIIENKPGAASLLGTTEVARATADGHTLLIGSVDGLVLQPALRRSPPYEPARDLMTLGGVASTPITMAASLQSGLSSVADVISRARVQPGSVRFGSPGVGSMPHLAAELFALQNRIQLTHVGYRGGAPALADLLANQIELLVSVPADVSERHKTGALKVLAQMGSRRHVSLPDVPTLKELGSNLVVNSWFALVAPRGLPQAVSEKLAFELAACLAQTEFREQMGKLGFDPLDTSLEEFSRFTLMERDRWSSVIRDAKIALLN